MKKKSWFYYKTEPFFEWMHSFYNRTLASFMKKKWIALLIVFFSFSLIGVLIKTLPSELIPSEDRNEFRIMSTAPEGSTFNYMTTYLDRMYSLVKKEVAEVDGIVSVTSPSFGGGSGVNSGFTRLILVDANKRKRSQQEIVNAITPKIMQQTEARSFITQPASIGNRRAGLPVQFVIQAPTVEKLREKIPLFMQEASKDPHFSFVDINLKFTKPEINIDIDRNKARNLGVSIRDIAQTLQLGMSGSRFGYFIMNGKQYQIIGQVELENRNDPRDIRSLYVKNQRGELVQLDNLIRINERSTPPALYRFNRFASATISASISPGYTIGDCIQAMENIAKKTLDETFATDLEGTSAEYRDSSSSLYFAFVFALVLIYLVLAAQFESFRDPITIMITVPMGIAGAFLSLWYFNQSLNLFSQIGIIMLIGLVTKNGILIVEFANQKIEEGIPVQEAIISSAEQRFRPILMTSFSTILGTLPIALALGAGSESRVSMGIAIIGGLIFSTFLTLYVIPAMYMYITDKKKK